jgi:predicted outer membrane repeat protein
MGATLAATGSAQAATITVTNLNDEGDGSLRQAVLDANQNGGGSDDIVFASGLSGAITLGSTSNYGIYPETAMNINGDGRITLQGGPNVDYVVYTGASGGYGGTPGNPITLSGLTITGGDATAKHTFDDGGGIYNRQASLTVTNSVITGNHADDDGGAIYNGYATASLTLVNSTVSGNDATITNPNSYGGAIFSKYSDVTVRNSTISGNRSGGDGGAIYMSQGGGGTSPSLTLENSTLANNASLSHSSDDDGGGVWICCGDYGQHLDIKSSTITGNSVGGTSGFGGGLYVFDLAPSSVRIQNSIIANNTGTFGNDIYSYQGGQIGFSLIKDPANSTGMGYSFTATGPNIYGVDPQLGGLANNGGPTQTQAPSGGSPVIDKGASIGLNSDQRGVVRPIDFPGIPNAAGGDGADIGAFELQPDNAFKLGKLKRNKKKGTAKLVVILPVPDAGSVTIQGKGMKTKTGSAADTGMLKLPVIPKGKKRKQENRTGKVKIKAKITYNAIGNAATTLTRKLKLKKKI